MRNKIKLFCVVLTLFMITPIYAHNEKLKEKELKDIPETLGAILINENGKFIDVELKSINEMKDIQYRNLKDGDTIEQEYEAYITPEMFRYTSVAQDEAWDSTGGVKAWLKVTYSSLQGSVLVEKVEGNWRNYDGASLNLSGYTVYAGTIGESSRTGQWVNQRIERRVSPPRIIML